MDPSEMLDPTSIPESSQMHTEENSQGNSGAPQITHTKNLSKLTITPGTNFPSPLPEDLPRRQARRESISQDMRDGVSMPYRRRGVRTLLSVRKERLARLRYLLLNRFSPVMRLSQKKKTNKKTKRNYESRSEPFKCGCSFCVHHRWDPSENARIGNYDYKPISP
uniref:Developmental pluripotency associated 3 n=1 Tax=Propithecus coquereli TaxID=379532 RepID=A0A2K6G2G4_PROCO